MNRGRLINTLIRHEGKCNKIYQCTAGKNTIGVGRNLDDNGLRDDEIMFLLKNDIDACENQCRNGIIFFEQLSDPRQEIIVEMCFQLGFKGLSGFKNFLHHAGQGDWIRAADEMLDSKWARVDSPERAREMARIFRDGRF